MSEQLKSNSDVGVAETFGGQLQYLNEPAKTAFRAAVHTYGEALLDEASRLEAVGKSTHGDPEITSTMVKDADILLRRGYSRPGKRPLIVVSQVIATIGGFLTGLLADANRLKEPSGLVLFVVVLAFTIVSAVIAILVD